MNDFSKYDLPRLRAELEQELEVKDMLKESVSDLQSTMCELQERLHSVDGEGNEWKTRYETQTELNGQLERQISMVHERLEDLRGNPMDRLASIRSYDDMTIDSLRQRLKLLTEEKSDLQSQLTDCRVRIDQEGKAFHKTNDERRAYLSEIAKLSSTIETQRRQYSTKPQRGVEGNPRVKLTSRKSEASEKHGKAVEGGAEREDAGGATAEGRRGTTSYRGNRLPTIKHHPKHRT
ncbi:coiled-coil domain containing 169 isoform X1 [Synchiropus splendidus]|uniref:coiled-coil domain containing 169 isoform X1 n=2 Tax=Synchiropus splendidus TaxID=270530 RepID=UPI00237DF9E1|nr:coiled-coil domain containing 169 isoform X1 [Synchiropus splendidus]